MMDTLNVAENVLESRSQGLVLFSCARLLLLYYDDNLLFKNFSKCSQCRKLRSVNRNWHKGTARS